MRRAVLSLVGMLCLTAPSLPAPDSTPPPATTQRQPTAPRVVDYTQLKQQLRDLRGQVVIVDFWKNTCLPCKKKSPELVAFYRARKADGLAIVTVNLDSPKDEQVMGLVKKFLDAQQADFTNFVLNEPQGVWESKFEYKLLPIV